MKTSLRQILIDYIKAHGKVHWKQLERFCGANEYRWADNGSRRLRDARDKNNKHYDANLGVEYYPNSDVIEYYTYGPRPLDPVELLKPSKQSGESTSSPDCCPSFKYFKVHAGDCIKLKETVKQGALNL